MGGALVNYGTLTITNTTITDNLATGNNDADYSGNGGGIASVGALTITNSTISGNSATASGGGIASGSIAIEEVIAYTVGQLEVTNSTISGNTAIGVAGDYYSGNGGGLYNYGGSTTVTNSTIAFNLATNGYGGGIANATTYYGLSPSFMVSNSIITGNSATAAMGVIPNTDVAAFTPDGTPIMSLGFNLVGQEGLIGSFPTIGSDLVLSGDPSTAILPLAETGGFTQTHALALNSPAIDAGDPNSILVIDQRGAQRGASGDNAGSRIDIGAHEETSSIEVTNTLDHNNLGSLRLAILFASGSFNNHLDNIANPAPNTITFDSSFDSPQLITLKLGELTLESPTHPNLATAQNPIPIHIQGAGVDNLTVSGNNRSRIFNVIAGEIDISELTLDGGQESTIGGGLLVGEESQVILSDLTVSNNIATDGGGIYNHGEVTITNSTISGNAAVRGGGLFNGNTGTPDSADNRYRYG